MATSADTTYNLTTLLASSPFALAYALPLLLLSLFITFAGTFLTLDRTRQFAPKSDVILPGAFDSPKKKLNLRLEGGVGGFAIGLAFGVHFSTLLALLIPSLSSAAKLSSKSFVAVWVFSSLLTAFLGGRWKYSALTFAGIAGGSTFAMAISVMIHPSKLTRVVFIGICIPIVTIACLLPLVRFQHASLRFATGSMGAFGVVQSIAILANIPAWTNVWSRLWTTSSSEWGTSPEKGLSAGFCLFLVAGMVCDFFLRAQFGECPDEKWDSYLANYAANLPDFANRAGTFKPLTSAWDRIFKTSAPPNPMDAAFADDKTMLHGPDSPLKSKHDSKSDYFDYQPTAGLLKKARSKSSTHFQSRAGGGRKARCAVKFRPIGEMSSDSEDDAPPPVRPWLKQRTSMDSTTSTVHTLVDGDLDYDSDSDPLVKKLGKVPEYSDYEDDLGAPKKGRTKEVPSFISRGLSSSDSNSSSTVAGGGPPGAVPYTPSLIKALDRVAAAQRDAHRADINQSQVDIREGMPASPKGEDWNDFWKDVGNKNSAKA
ncbi:hypothetical protein CYLTODRAFT_375306 [Cylindrobasidium torrendii FP15055 ss-10]|uniref:DUF4203 domain-containing protein n=1 Tax=Cylindrobasidium torrendii FP15055 ss-10 TaxID=1314674 RepID=A0A0D7BCG9_9AGAR|nr:hypothetical protein CYLTODRAFT_375306 [Cylindrobasidium torrendii FP15055 ss-10]